MTRRHLPEKRNPQPQPFETSTLEHELRLDGGIVLCDVTRCTVFLVADGGSEWFATVYQTARHITPGVKKKIHFCRNLESRVLLQMTAFVTHTATPLVIGTRIYVRSRVQKFPA